MVDDKTQTAETKRRWLAPVAAAASVALIGGVIWGVSSNDSNSNDSNQQAAPAVTQSATAPASVPAAGPSKAPSPVPNVAPPPPPSSARTGATTQATLPVYFLGFNSRAGAGDGLYREFVRTAVPAGATAAEKARAALAVAMKPFPRKSVPQFGLTEQYIFEIWDGESVTNVTVTPTRITITLDGPGRVDPAHSYAGPVHELSIQQLVWTAQAAVGQGAIPVKFVTPGSANLFEDFPTSKTYNRPSPGLQYRELAPIWITSPTHGQVMPAGSPVVATGQSCAFEGTTQWQLKKDGKVVKSGFTTATSGCPPRGTWQVKLGVLAPGSYAFRMYALSREYGKRIIAETAKPFTVS